MFDDEIQVKLEGERIDPRAVADAIFALDKILRHITADEPPRLTLSMLETGSAIVTVRSDPQRVALVRGGLDILATSTTMPPGWSPESVAGLVELEHVSARRGVEQILLRSKDALSEIDDQLVEHAKASIAPHAPSLGSVRGKLHRYINDHNRRSAGLRDYRTGHVVELLFPSHLTTDVRSALDHEVEVWGEVRRDTQDRILSITATGIEIIDESRAAVTLDDVAGILGPDWTSGLDPVEWVRRQRG